MIGTELAISRLKRDMNVPGATGLRAEAFADIQILIKALDKAERALALAQNPHAWTDVPSAEAIADEVEVGDMIGDRVVESVVPIKTTSLICFIFVDGSAWTVGQNQVITNWKSGS